MSVPSGKCQSPVRPQGAEAEHEPAFPQRVGSSPGLAQRSLLDVFEDQPKPSIPRPSKGQLATELRVPPAPGWRSVACHCSNFLFQEAILITKDASGQGQAASRQGRGGLPLQASPRSPATGTQPQVRSSNLCRSRLQRFSHSFLEQKDR